MPRDLLKTKAQHGIDQFPTNPEKLPQEDSNLDNFFQFVDNVEQKLTKLQDCINQVRMQQSEQLSAPRQDVGWIQKLDELKADIRKLAGEIRSDLKKIELSAQEMEASNPTDPFVAISRTQLLRLTTLLKTEMNNYSEAQIKHHDACKEQLRRKLEIGETTFTEDQLRQMMASDNTQVFTQCVISDMRIARQHVAELTERHEDLMKLEKDIRTLQEVMETLQMHVEEQGAVVNQIAKNVDNTKDYVEEAKVATKQAVVYQRSANKKKWIIIGVVIAVVVVLVIILVASLVPR